MTLENLTLVCARISVPVVGFILASLTCWAIKKFGH